MVNIGGFESMWSVYQLFNSTVAAEKQPLQYVNEWRVLDLILGNAVAVCRTIRPVLLDIQFVELKTFYCTFLSQIKNKPTL